MEFDNQAFGAAADRAGDVEVCCGCVAAYGRFMDTLQKARQELELPLAEEMIQAYYDESQRGFAYAESLGWTEKDGLKELWLPQGGE